METSWTVYQNLITCLTKYRGLEVEEVLEKEDFDDSLSILIDDKKLSISNKIANNLYIQK